MKQKSRTSLIVTSSLLVLNIMFVPIYRTWGGLFPDHVSRDFFDCIEALIEDGDAWSFWAVQFTWLMFIPAVLLLIFALIDSRGLCMITSATGCVLIIYKIGELIDYFGDSDVVFDFEECSVSIGTWIAFILFIIAFFTSVSAKKEEEQAPMTQPPIMNIQSNPVNADQQPLNNTAVFTQAPAVTRDVNDSVHPETIQSTTPPAVYHDPRPVPTFCPNCGTRHEQSHQFCGNCGHKL